MICFEMKGVKKMDLFDILDFIGDLIFEIAIAVTVLVVICSLLGNIALAVLLIFLMLLVMVMLWRLDKEMNTDEFKEIQRKDEEEWEKWKKEHKHSTK